MAIIALVSQYPRVSGVVEEWDKLEAPCELDKS
ncbi:hypothetical protein COLO4_06739 [Corchorus olitorius]|uniref:Uncharacterized protein n=1 Tax=Corchorus olitorius TaxID=93759 RepID=A0A1R3KM28_9ROSI|nr:hypothetical protein COLO4_06739 [Corchorus olitorius]